MGSGQIAVRGPLVVVASRGVPNKSDAADGVYIIDGRDEVASDPERIVRKIDSPTKAGQRDGGSDAVGVALDGDFVVFGTYAGSVSKVRLDGVPLWQFTDWPSDTRPGLPALIDVNGDGKRDVIVPVIPLKPCAAPNAGVCGPAWDVLAIALNGRDGKLLWKAQDGSLSVPTYDYVVAISRRCADIGVVHDPKTRRIRVECAGRFHVGAELDLFAAELDFDGKSEPPAASDAVVPHPSRVTLRGVIDDGPAYIESGSTQASANSLWVETVHGRDIVVSGALQLDGPVQSRPSLGDVNGNGVWDVLVVAGGALRAFSTGSRSDADLPLWRGDSAASGAMPLVDSPAAYKSRVEPRDLPRWLLKIAREPADTAFALDTTLPGRTPPHFERGPVELPGTADAKSGPLVVAQLSCDRSYGINEGNLVVRNGSDWAPVSGAPWPLIGLACVDQALVLETQARRYFRLAEPLPWRAIALLALVLVAASATFAGRYTTREPLPFKPIGESLAPPAARGVVFADKPKQHRAEAHALQTQLLDGLLNVLDNADTRPPVTLALHGAWGSGKSSVMQMLRADLKATGRYIDVWFNAWRFQREPDLAPALLQTIVDEVGRQTDWVTRVAVVWNRVRRASVRDIAIFILPPLVLALLLALCVRWAATHGASSGTRGGLGLASFLVLFAGGAHRLLGPLLKVFSLDPAKLLASADSKQRIQFVREFPAEFERIAKELPRGTRLVVFIDDLDRCAPERIVGVLETLSMLADTGCGFFVLAIDPTTVRRAIELTYRDLLNVARDEDPAEARDFGLRYLEKMITLGVKVPVLPAVDVKPEERPKTAEVTPGLLEWLRTRVLPEPPLLIALALLGIGSVAAVQHLDRMNEILDATALVFDLFPGTSSEQAKAEPKPANALDPSPTTVRMALQAAPASQATPDQAMQATDTARNVAKGASTKEKPTAPRARAPVLDPPPVPAVVQSVVRENPSTAIKLSRIFATLVAVLALVALLVISAVIWSEWQRRKRIGDARPMGTDSPAFAAALGICKLGLDATPREVVRFTNTSRFLYQVVSRNEPRSPEPGVAAAPDLTNAAGRSVWESEFFTALRIRWQRGNDQPVADWLKAELERWLPQDAMISPWRDRDPEVASSPEPTQVPIADDSAAPSAAAALRRLRDG